MATVRSPSPSLKELQAQIAELQAKAEEVRRSETAEVISRIKEAIDFYGFSASDLGLGGQRGRKPAVNSVAPVGRAARKPAGKAVGVPKYTSGTGKTWTGHGKRPQWFVEALAAGKTADDMLIKRP
jgi:DNA-binding protein H-NS